ncbi:hypothetical protein D9M72_329690 [compost metagenome]
MGLLKSSSFMPVARHSERAPAMLRPAVEVLERYVGIVLLRNVARKVAGHGMNGPARARADNLLSCALGKPWIIP